MQICNNGHNDVAFEGPWARDCPACEALEALRLEMQSEIDGLNSDISKMEG